LPRGAIEPSQGSGKFYEAAKFETEKDGAFNDYGKPKQHYYYALGVVLSNVKAWRRRIEKRVGGRGYKSIW